MFESWTRRSSVGAVFVALLASATLVLADEKIIPTEQYNTEKARALAKTYEGHLRHLSDTIPHCYPWVAIQKAGLGFRKPKGSANDDRYLSVWVWVEQYYTPEFAATPRDGRASAMFQRYALDLLKRLASHSGLLADPSVKGFAVVLSWQKPVASLPPGAQPLGETLAVFMEKEKGQKLFKRQISPAEFVKASFVNNFEGKQELGTIPLSLHHNSQVQHLVSPDPPDASAQC